MTDRSETVETVTVSASRKVQLEDFEPIEAYVAEEHIVPDDVDYEDWLESLQDDVMAAAEDAAMRRFEEHVREESFGDD
jgi:uncharacterized protein YecA (UPF0149 family)